MLSIRSIFAADTPADLNGHAQAIQQSTHRALEISSRAPRFPELVVPRKRPLHARGGFDPDERRIRVLCECRALVAAGVPTNELEGVSSAAAAQYVKDHLSSRFPNLTRRPVEHITRLLASLERYEHELYRQARALHAHLCQTNNLYILNRLARPRLDVAEFLRVAQQLPVRFRPSFLGGHTGREVGVVR